MKWYLRIYSIHLLTACSWTCLLDWAFSFNMSDEYRRVVGGRLKLKGGKRTSAIPKKSGAKKRHQDEPSESDLAYCGWWPFTENTSKTSCSVALETMPHTYVMALDNGKFTLGAAHTPGEGPSPEEIFVFIRPLDAPWIALKSGYDKYLGVNNDGYVVAVADAIGARERWELIFEDGKMALLSSNGFFFSHGGDDEGYLMANSKTAKENEIITIRTNAARHVPAEPTPDVDLMPSKQCELSYVKMYQHSKVRINADDRKYIRQAKGEGNLHEVLLDRREKMKADRYCK
uniref:FRG1-like family protein n=1 Tax=Trichuris muris TaxID=70415 RepID=A0A5S6Q8L0_TRIMR